MQLCRLLFAAFLLAPLPALIAADIFVAKDGNDKAAGTLAAPFRTIQRAFDRAGPGDKVVLRDVVYREAVSLRNKSGKAGAPIILTAHPGEQATLSGLDVLKLEWKATAQPGIYSALFDTKSIAQLFYNGKPMLEARWPNVPKETNGDWDFFSPAVWASADSAGNSYGTLVCGDLGKTGWDVTGAQALLNVDHQFFSWTRQVRSHSAGSSAFTYDQDLGKSVNKPDETGVHGKWNQQNKFYLFGQKQFLDAPGEWYYDAAAKRLHVCTPDGKNPAAAVLEIKTREWGFLADEASSYLTIDGIGFFATAFRFGRDADHKSAHIIFRNNTVLYSSWNEYVGLPTSWPGLRAEAVYPTIEADSARVVNNKFAFGALTGLYVNGFDHLIENNLFHSFCYSSSLMFPPLQVSRASPGMEGKAGRAIIRHNTLSRSGGIQVQVAQVANDGDDNTCGLTVDHNVTWDLGAAGIEIKNVDNPTPEQANRCVNNTVFNHSAYNPIKSAILIPSIRNDWNRHSTVANNLADSITGWWFGRPLGKIKQVSNNEPAFNPAADLVNPAWFDFRPAAGAAAIIDRGVVIEAVTGRFVGQAPDIGAYERGDSVYWIPGRRETKASFPIVPDGTQEVPIDRDLLMWRPAYQAVAHQVHFDPSHDVVTNADQRKPHRQGKFKGEANVFPLPQLAAGQKYWWRVDAVMPDGSIVRGELWSFTTSLRR
ncbi:MAG: right-handed parallel beta-helix repeat-containing protein [Verrucomicrobia bacterium]|nr:right-handed parallel beta-helix repeat-containing protein [Verrucomicrobiota bacterium]